MGKLLSPLQLRHCCRWQRWRKISCPTASTARVFEKLSDGSWWVDGTTTFDAGAASAMTLSHKAVSRRMMNVGGADLFDVIEAKCGRR